MILFVERVELIHDRDLIALKPRVNPVLVRGTGRISSCRERDVQGERIYVREHNVEYEAERYIDTSRPLGEPRYRHYVAYLAFNLINEGGSASVVTRPTTHSHALFSCQ